MIPTPKQCEVINLAQLARKPICWLGGVRAGKTVGSCMALLNVMKLRPGPYGIMSFSRANTDRNIRPVLIDLLDAEDVEWTERKSPPEHIETPWGRILFFTASDRGAEKTLQGVTLRGALTDEILLFPRNVIMQLIARFTHEHPTWLMTCNKSDPNHWIKTEWIDCEKVIEVNSTVDENPHVSDDAKDWHGELIGGHYRERMVSNEWQYEHSLVRPLGKDQIGDHDLPRSAPSRHLVSVWFDPSIGVAASVVENNPGRIVVRECYEGKTINDLPDHLWQPDGLLVSNEYGVIADLKVRAVVTNGDIGRMAVHMTEQRSVIIHCVQACERVGRDLAIWSYEASSGEVGNVRVSRTSPSVLSIGQGYSYLTQSILPYGYKGAA